MVCLRHWWRHNCGGVFLAVTFPYYQVESLHCSVEGGLWVPQIHFVNDRDLNLTTMPQSNITVLIKWNNSSTVIYLNWLHGIIDLLCFAIFCSVVDAFTKFLSYEQWISVYGVTRATTRCQMFHAATLNRFKTKAIETSVINSLPTVCFRGDEITIRTYYYDTRLGFRLCMVLWCCVFNKAYVYAEENIVVDWNRELIHKECAWD